MLRGMLRRLSLLVLSLWFGTGVGVAFIAIPVVFSPEIKTTLPPGMAGGVAQAILLRLFMWQVGFAGLSGLLYAWERLRDAEASGRLRAWLLPPLILVSLISLFFVHPYLARMHQERYAIETPEPRRRELATRFGAVHGASQAANLMILIGVLACWQNVAHPVSSFAGRNGRVVP
jgi:hypothetical protein